VSKYHCLTNFSAPGHFEPKTLMFNVSSLRPYWNWRWWPINWSAVLDPAIFLTQHVKIPLYAKFHTFCRMWTSFSHICPTIPTLLWGPHSGTPSEFLDETYPAETRRMGLLYGENCIILTSNAFDWSIRVTDRRTDGIAMEYSLRAIAYAVVRNNWP